MLKKTEAEDIPFLSGVINLPLDHDDFIEIRSLLEQRSRSYLDYSTAAEKGIDVASEATRVDKWIPSFIFI